MLKSVHAAVLVHIRSHTFSTTIQQIFTHDGSLVTTTTQLIFTHDGYLVTTTTQLIFTHDGSLVTSGKVLS